MTRRARVDAELVRRGLARSRQQAAELIGAGRVTHQRDACGQACDGGLDGRDADGRRGRTHLGVREEPTSSSAPSTHSACRWRTSAAWTRAPPPAASPRCCSIAGPAKWSPSTSDTGSWHGRCGPMTRVTVLERTNVRELTRGIDRRSRRHGGGRPVFHLAVDGAARAGCMRVGRRRYRSHGEATVRGRQGPGGCGRGGVGPGAARRRGARGRTPGRRAELAHRRRHGQPAARTVRKRRILPAAARRSPTTPACRASSSSRRSQRAVDEGPQ